MGFFDQDKKKNEEREFASGGVSPLTMTVPSNMRCFSIGSIPKRCSKTSIIQ